MCGKFDGPGILGEVVDFPQPLTESGGGERGGEGSSTKSSPIASVACCRWSFGMPSKARGAW